MSKSAAITPPQLIDPAVNPPPAAPTAVPEGAASVEVEQKSTRKAGHLAAAKSAGGGASR
jgi:hypothetical protein